MYFLCSLEVVGWFLVLLYARSLRRVMRLISVVIQGWWKRVVVILLGTCCASRLVRLVLMLSHIVGMELLMVNIWMNDVVNACASCLRWSMSARRQRCIFLRAGLARCACADE